MSGTLPQESESQRVGYLAERCLYANQPDSWRLTPLGGTQDFGFDYQAQLQSNGSIKDIFRIQLKGTESPSKNTDGTFFSVDLKASTVEYYRRATEPILLVLSDLSVDPASPKSCPLYYCWIEDELDRINAQGLKADQNSVTLRVPCNNRLDAATDVAPHIAHYKTIANVGKSVDAVIKENQTALSVDARVPLLNKFASGVRRRGYAFIESITELDTPWPQPPNGSYAWYSNEAYQRLRGGDATTALELLDKASALSYEPNPVELGENWSLRGRVFSLLGDEERACKAFQQACRVTDNSPNHVACFAEAELRRRYIENIPSNYADLLDMLTATDAETLSTRSRIIAASGDFATAISVAKSIPGCQGYAAQAIVFTMNGEVQNAIDACTAGLQEENTPQKTIQLFLVLRVRGYFNLAVRDADMLAGNHELPLSGTPSTDLEKLRAAWPDIEAAAQSFRKSGWAQNIEFFADVWSYAAAVLGKQQETLPLLAEAAKARPHIVNVQLALESLAALYEDFSTALTANDRQPKTSETTLRKISYLHSLKRHAECVRFTLIEKSTLNSKDKFFGTALSMAATSADRLVRTDIADEWANELAADSRFAPESALLTYFRTILRSPLHRDEALRTLIEKFDSLNYPKIIALDILHQLHPGKPVEAEHFWRIANMLRHERLLSLEATEGLCEALVTLHMWKDLEALAADSLMQFEDSMRFAGFRALALDKLGRTSEALEALQPVISSVNVDPNAISTYINIAVRSGMADEAIVSVESMLSRAQSKIQRIEYLRVLFGLLSHSNPGDHRCVDVAWRIGEQADQENEEQEGLFLTTMLHITCYVVLDPSDHRRSGLQQRLQAFSTRFPASRILKLGQIPEEASGAEILKVLNELAGVTSEQLRWRHQVQEQLRRGTLKVPYEWIPRNFLAGIPDVPTLWELAKHSGSDQVELHLHMSAAEWQPISLSLVYDRIPLLDLVALLVLADLGLLEEIFKIFPKIAIAQRTLFDINALTSSVAGSAVRGKALTMQAIFKSHLSRIVQPTVALEADEKRDRFAAADEIKRLAADNAYILYSDDALFRIHCNPSTAPPSICTLDLLWMLDHAGHISPSVVAEKIAQLCEWHVALSVHFRYQMAALPVGLNSVSTVRDGVKLLRTSKTSDAIFRAIWGTKKPFSDLLDHATAVLRQLVDEPANEIISIASVLALWHEKARLQADAALSPIKVAAHLLLRTVTIGNSPSEISMRRLWKVFLLLVENEHGDQMDEGKEANAISLVAQIAASSDAKQSLHGNQTLRSRLLNGLIEGTQDHGIFLNAYVNAVASKV